MPSHDNLLRLHRWRLDERRHYAAELEALSGRLRADLGLLQAAIALESETLDPPPRSEADRHPAALVLMERHRKLAHSLAEIERQIVAARAAVAAAEQEVAAQELASAHRKGVGRAMPSRVGRDNQMIASPIFARRFAS